MLVKEKLFVSEERLILQNCKLWSGGISHILIQLCNLNALICTSYIESRSIVCSSKYAFTK